jgi:hypothetical protein
MVEIQWIGAWKGSCTRCRKNPGADRIHNHTATGTVTHSHLCYDCYLYAEGLTPEPVTAQGGEAACPKNEVNFGQGYETPESARDELARLRQWVHDLQSGMYVNCVYCGYRYGPNGDTAVTMQDALYAHVRSCPKHPLAKAEANLDCIRRQIATLNGDDPETWPDHGNAPLAISAWLELLRIRMEDNGASFPDAAAQLNRDADALERALAKPTDGIPFDDAERAALHQRAAQFRIAAAYLQGAAAPGA